MKQFDGNWLCPKCLSTEYDRMGSFHEASAAGKCSIDRFWIRCHCGFFEGFYAADVTGDKIAEAEEWSKKENERILKSWEQKYKETP